MLLHAFWCPRCPRGTPGIQHVSQKRDSCLRSASLVRSTSPIPFESAASDLVWPGDAGVIGQCVASPKVAGLAAGALAASEVVRIEVGCCIKYGTLCYAIVLPGRQSAFRAGFWPDCYRESIEIGPPAGRRQSGQNPARKADLQPGSTIA